MLKTSQGTTQQIEGFKKCACGLNHDPKVVRSIGVSQLVLTKGQEWLVYYFNCACKTTLLIRDIKTTG